MQADTKNILVITKYRFIGDTLTAIPTIRAAKERWPEANVHLLSGARACELLQNSPYVDGFIEFDPYRESDNGLKQYLRLISSLRRHRFDMALVLNRSFHSALTAALGGAKKRVGWSGFEGRDFLLTDRCKYGSEKAEIDCFLDVFRTASKSEPFVDSLELWITHDEIWEASKSLPQNRKLIGIQPGATHGYKQWPLDNFVKLAEALIRQSSENQIILIGGKEERPVVDAFYEKISQDVAQHTTDLVGKLSLRLTLGAVSQLNIFVGNDTAIRHAAVALDIPSIGIFGPTSCSKWGNAAPPRHIVVSSTTGKMEDVAVDSVIGLVENLQGDQLVPKVHERGSIGVAVK